MSLKMENLRMLNKESEAILVSLHNFYLESKYSVHIDTIIEFARKYDRKLKDLNLAEALYSLSKTGYISCAVFASANSSSPGKLLERLFFPNIYSPDSWPTTSTADYSKFELTDIGRQAAMYLRTRGEKQHCNLYETKIGQKIFDELDEDLKAELSSEILCIWAHHSTALVGNSLSINDMRSIIEGEFTNAKGNFPDFLSAAGFTKAAGFFWPEIENKTDITFDILFKLHSTIMSANVAGDPLVGAWKVVPSGKRLYGAIGQNGWYDFVPPKLTPEFMQYYLKKMNESRTQNDKADDARIGKYTDLQCALYAIHPFKNGNILMAQILANLPRLWAGLPPIVILKNSQGSFFELLNKWCRSKEMPKKPEELFNRNKEWLELRNFFEESSGNLRETTNYIAKFQQYRKIGK